MEEEAEERNFKIVLLGDTGVGKTSIINQYTKEEMSDKGMSTVGVSYTTKTLKLERSESILKLEIWDTAGQEKYRSIAKIYYQTADCILFVYDITRRESFESLKSYYDLVIKSIDSERVMFVLVGNKSDLYEIEQVNRKEALEYAKSIGGSLKWTSAKNSSGLNVK